MKMDPICGMQVDENTAQYKTEYNGNTYYFCAPGCKKIFEAEPEKYLKTGTSGIRISSIIIALSLLALVTIGVYLLESEKPQVDLLGARENSEAGIKITLTYLPDISDATGGHHASGTLRFQKIESNRFDVVIQDVADVKERIFKW